jgi:ferric-dicitrate binding protein FerR (iron transport regulator)
MTQNIHNQNRGKKLNNSSDLEQKILRHASSLNVPGGLSKEEALKKLKTRISSGDTNLRVRKNHLKTILLYSSVAATLLLLVGIWRIWLYNPFTEVVAARSRHIDYTLPDGSLVRINSESKISFHKKDFLSERRLKMDGEAYFEITKGSDFVISTKYADVKILGTTFNIFSRGSDFRVSCLTGKIQVSDKKSSVVIIPGESAALRDNVLFNYEDKNVRTSNSWTVGEFYFENAPLKTIFEEIERQFNVTFETQNAGNKLFTGSFSNNNLEDALQIVCIPMGLKYEIGKNNKIYITEKNP